MEVLEIKDLALFSHLSDEEIECSLKSLSYKEKTYDKEEIILHARSTTKEMGIVLSGSVTIENIDLFGNRTILSHIGEKGIFAETYAFLPQEPLAVDVIANEKTRVLFLNLSGLYKACNFCQNTSWRHQFFLNLTTLFAHKNLHLSNRTFHTAPKTIRGKLTSYLNHMAFKKGNSEFTIPFNRQELADYLNVERTSLSKEITKMRKEGLIESNRSHFKILTELEEGS